MLSHIEAGSCDWRASAAAVIAYRQVSWAVPISLSAAAASTWICVSRARPPGLVLQFAQFHILIVPAEKAAGWVLWICNLPLGFRPPRSELSLLELSRHHYACTLTTKPDERCLPMRTWLQHPCVLWCHCLIDVIDDLQCVYKHPVLRITLIIYLHSGSKLLGF